MSLTVEQGKQLITEFCHQYPLASQVQYKVRSKQEDIFHAEATIEKVGKIYGAYFPSRNIAGFATANFRDEDQFKGTLRHEILGHFGLNTFSVDDKKRLLTAIIVARDEPTIQPLWSKVEKFYPESSDTLKAEELYAFVCEDIKPSLTVDNKLGEQSFKDSCKNQSKRLKMNNVVAIASMVANGLADGSRKQQIFPKTDIDQFQKEVMVEQDQPLNEAKPLNGKQDRGARPLTSEQRLASYEHQAKRCEQLWSQLKPAKNNEYLKSKGIDAYDVRQDKKGRLVVPLRDENGNIWSIQHISGNGFKSMKKGAKQDGSFHTLNVKSLSRSSVILVAESYSTASTLAKATDITTVAAINAGNLPQAASTLKARYPDKDIVICGDEDRLDKKSNKGRDKAEEAAKLVGTVAIFPRFFREKNQKLSDWNDLYQETGLDTIKSQLAGPLARLKAKRTSLKQRKVRKASKRTSMR